MLPKESIVDTEQLRGLVHERNVYAYALERIANISETATGAVDGANEAMRIARNALREAIVSRPTPTAREAASPAEEAAPNDK